MTQNSQVWEVRRRFDLPYRKWIWKKACAQTLATAVAPTLALLITNLTAPTDRVRVVVRPRHPSTLGRRDDSPLAPPRSI